uniref:Uncharacterized protein n=1 Tax=Glycine max TaxID=3847 RepID=C6T3A3_SOYBN|nr:unknown [Glycine max]
MSFGGTFDSNSLGVDFSIVLDVAAVSSSSQLRMCLTLRRKTEADCLTSLLRRRTTALTPATVSTKFVSPMMPSLHTQHGDPLVRVRWVF